MIPEHKCFGVVPGVVLRAGSLRIACTARHVCTSTIAGQLALTGLPLSSRAILPAYTTNPASAGDRNISRKLVPHHSLPLGVSSPCLFHSRQIDVSLSPLILRSKAILMAAARPD
jgi:hypothetical protein